jgi:hypothetical protein
MTVKEIKALLPLLDVAAKTLAAVQGPVWSYDSGEAIAAFVLKCKTEIERGTITFAQKRELWSIFAPTSDWDDVMGDYEIGNQIFSLIESLYWQEIKEGRGND